MIRGLVIYILNSYFSQLLQQLECQLSPISAELQTNDIHENTDSKCSKNMKNEKYKEIKRQYVQT